MTNYRLKRHGAKPSRQSCLNRAGARGLGVSAYGSIGLGLEANREIRVIRC